MLLFIAKRLLWMIPSLFALSFLSFVLIQLPPGYPDVAPDMFYLMPWVKLRNGGRYPSAANVAQSFAGQTWQRWSRHNSEWRPGIDGIWTMIKRVEDALEKAA